MAVVQQFKLQVGYHFVVNFLRTSIRRPGPHLHPLAAVLKMRETRTRVSGGSVDWAYISAVCRQRLRYKPFPKPRRFLRSPDALFGCFLPLSLGPILSGKFRKRPHRSFPARSGAPMMAGVIFIFRRGFAAVFISYCRSLIACLLEAALSAEVKAVTGIQRIALGMISSASCNCCSLPGCARKHRQQRPGDWTYFRLLNFCVPRLPSSSLRCRTGRNRTRHARSFARRLGRRISFSRDMPLRKWTPEVFSRTRFTGLLSLS